MGVGVERGGGRLYTSSRLQTIVPYTHALFITGRAIHAWTKKHSVHMEARAARQEQHQGGAVASCAVGLNQFEHGCRQRAREQGSRQAARCVLLVGLSARAPRRARALDWAARPSVHFVVVATGRCSCCRTTTTWTYRSCCHIRECYHIRGRDREGDRGELHVCAGVASGGVSGPLTRTSSPGACTSTPCGS